MIELEGYRMVGKIASGASGTVYRAIQEGLMRPVAVKLLAPGMFNAEETRQRFLRETRLQAKLSHPNLVALYDADFAGVDDAPYCVMELVEGGTLRNLIEKEGPLTVAEAVRLAAGIASGLAHAHEAGIVHRDLKPENVLLTPGREPKVGDFGLARSELSDGDFQTAVGLVLGTPGYVSPEALQGKTAGPEADVFALGIIMWEMLAGNREAIGSGDSGHVLGRTRPMPSLAASAQAVPAALDKLVQACLGPDPAKRPSAAAVVTELARIPRTRGAVSKSAPPPGEAAPAPTPVTSVMSTDAIRKLDASVPAAREGHRIPRKAWLALVLLGVAVVVLALGLMRPPPIPPPPLEIDGPGMSPALSTPSVDGQ